MKLHSLYYMRRLILAFLTLTFVTACASDDDLGKGLQDVGKPDPSASVSSMSSSMVVEP